MIIWVIAGLLGLATGLRIGWALVNKQSLVSTAMILALGSPVGRAELAAADAADRHRAALAEHCDGAVPGRIDRLRCGQLRDDHDGGVGAVAFRQSQNCYRAARRCRAVIAVVSLVIFAAGQQPEMAPRNASSATRLQRRKVAGCRCSTCCWR